MIEKEEVLNAIRLRKFTPQQTFKAGLDLIDFNLKLVIDSIKRHKPKISQRKLEEEVKRVYRLCEKLKKF